jgi:hypothetical protein
MLQGIVWETARKSGYIILTICLVLSISALSAFAINEIRDSQAPVLTNTNDPAAAAEPVSVSATDLPSEKPVSNHTLPPSLIPVLPENVGITGSVKKKARMEPPFKITGSFNRRIQEYSGVTASSEFLTNIILHTTLKKLFGGKIKIRVKTYSLTDLWHLKVKRARISLSGSHYKDIPLGKVEIESQTPFWFVFAHRRLEVKNPSLFNFKMTINEKELDQILHSSKATNSLKALRLDLSSMGTGMDEQRIQMREPEVNIDDGRIMVRAKLATQDADPATSVLMTISGAPKLHENDKIFLEEIKIDSTDITDPEKFSKFVEALINPLINLHRFDKANFAIRLDDISVKSKALSVTGRLLLGPSSQNKTIR